MAAVALVTPHAASGGDSRQCMKGLSKSLVAGRYSGPIACYGDDASLNLIGKSKSRSYTVFDYRYRIKAAQVKHGGQRVLIFQNGSYVGQYALSPPPFATLTLKADDLQIAFANGRDEAHVDLSSAPPSCIWAGGMLADLFR